VSVFDYIIVGAGSSGCVLANRLSAEPNVSVLLIEAGPRDDNPLIHMPRGYLRTHRDPRLTWYFPVTVTDERCDWRGSLLGGKVLGGSSAINSMLYVRGQPQDYDDWATGSAPGWGWDAMALCFREVERHILGTDGSIGNRPAHIASAWSRDGICNALIASGVDMGLTYKADINAGDQVGVGFFPTTIRHGRRVSAASAFLTPIVSRSNLTIATNNTVTKIIFEGTRARGVSCQSHGAGQEFHASREIILCAGALQSPKLLQLSGVGPANHLRSLGIGIVNDSPGVGKNLRDHWQLRLQFRIVRGKGYNHHLVGFRRRLNDWRYRLFRSGIMASAPSEIAAFIKVRPGADRADAQLNISLSSNEPGVGAFERKPGLRCTASTLRPESRGSVMIRSADPAAAPVIRTNVLSEEYDREVTIGMVLYTRRLMSHPLMQPYIGQETFPGSSCRADDEIVDVCRRHGSSGSHFSSTCRMGQDRLSVLDERLRVRGVYGLRVADASIMPTLVSGNINGPVMAMAWHAADLILEDSRVIPLRDKLRLSVC
jgi:choline dehydrogenase-like flavoprotein